MSLDIFYPAVSGDDGFWYSTTLNITSDFNYLGDVGLGINCWTRFTNITIPQGVTIINAFVRFTSYSSDSNTTTNVNIYFNDVDDAVAPTSTSEANALDLTDVIAWDNIEAWTNGVQYDTPDLSSIFQTIVDRAGWSSNNSVQVVLKNNASTTSAHRDPSTIDYSSGAEKAELHITWEHSIVFTFSDPIPNHLSTVYGTTEQLYLTTTVSGAEESYIYAATFYDGYGTQIGTTVSGINSGSPAASNTYLSTPSGIDYNWYVITTSSGNEGTSQTYTFSNRFLYEGYVTEEDTPVNRTVRLYYRNTGELIDSTTSSGGDGYYMLGAVTNDEHFIVTFDDEAGKDYNALILDRLLPNGEE